MARDAVDRANSGPTDPAYGAKISYASLQKAAASKAFLERHYGSRLQEARRGITRVVGPREREVTVDDLHLIKKIGRGAFGEVYLCQRKDDTTGRLYALKRMRKTDMLKKKQIMHVRSEKDILSLASAKNPYVVTLYASFQDKENLYMLMEYMPGGDMITWLCEKIVFDVETTRFYIAELCMAVASVHAMNFVHRDIKPDNILFALDGHIKLSDFGLSKRFTNVSDTFADDYIAAAAAREPTSMSVPSTSNALSSAASAMTTGATQASRSTTIPSSSSNGSRSGTSCSNTTTTTTNNNNPNNANHSSSSNTITGNGNSSNHTVSSAVAKTRDGHRTENTLTANPVGTSASSTSNHSSRLAFFDSIVGSAGYVAPEILLRKRYGVSCDWWSVGVIMYEMLYGRTPFLSQDSDATYRMIVRWRDYLRFPANPVVPPEAVDFMQRLLCDPADRMDFEQICAHSFFAGVDLAHIREAKPMFTPALSNPLDTKYFPEIDEACSTYRGPDDGTVREIDPCGVLFADFRFNVNSKLH